MNYIRWFPGDYLRDTMHLTWLEDLAYRRLLEVYYSNERALPIDRKQLYRIVRAASPDEQQAVESVLAEFFKVSRKKLVNLRAEKELKRYGIIRQKRVSAGKQRAKQVARAEQRYQQTGTSPAPAPAPAPAKDKREEKTFRPTDTVGPLRPSQAFAVFWDAYPRQVNKQPAIKEWIRNVLDDRLGEVLASLEAWKKNEWATKESEFIPHASTWLHQGRWKESPQKPTGAKIISLEDQLKAIEGKNGPRSKSHAN